jgi:tetratricopeptide (TPR) repeat protein
MAAGVKLLTGVRFPPVRKLDSPGCPNYDQGVSVLAQLYEAFLENGIHGPIALQDSCAQLDELVELELVSADPFQRGYSLSALGVLYCEHHELAGSAQAQELRRDILATLSRESVTFGELVAVLRRPARAVRHQLEVLVACRRVGFSRRHLRLQDGLLDYPEYLAHILERREREQEARRLLSEGLNLPPFASLEELLRARVQRADVLYREGRTEDALGELRRCRQAVPEDGRIRRILERVEREARHDFWEGFWGEGDLGGGLAPRKPPPRRPGPGLGQDF